MKFTALLALLPMLVLLQGAKCPNDKEETVIPPYTYALLSADVYERESQKLPPNWEIYLDAAKSSSNQLDLDINISSTTSDELGLGELIKGFAEQLFSKGGYAGRAYRNVKTNELIIAHRGTDPFEFSESEQKNVGAFFNQLVHSIRDISADLQIYNGEVPEEQFLAARQFTQLVRDSFERQYQSSPQLSFTGHSLGAVLAELSALEQDLPATTFESPGSAPMAQKLLSEQTFNWPSNKIKIYNAAPNLINTANGQVGQIIRLFPTLPNEVSEQKSSNLKDRLASSYFQFSWKQHRIDEVVKSFNPTDGQARIYAKIDHWPSAGKEDLKGMQHFLNPGNHPHWWNKILKNDPDRPNKKSNLEKMWPFENTDPNTTGLYIIGNAEDNHLYGGTNYADTLQAMAGNDTLRAYDGADYLLGGNGNDVLYGGMGNDRMMGGNGKDQYCFVYPGFGHDLISDKDGELFINGQLLKGKAIKKQDFYEINHHGLSIKLQKEKTDLLLQIGEDQIRLKDHQNGRFNLTIK